MVKCKLAVLLAERLIKISKVSKDTGISRTTLTALYYSTSKGVNFETISILCGYLNVSIGDLFEIQNKEG
jgi:putative transcriptional regulator